MEAIRRKLVVDESGKPQEVIIAWDDFREISEMMGWDLDADAIRDLREARRDRESGRHDAYVDLDDV